MWSLGPLRQLVPKSYWSPSWSRQNMICSRTITLRLVGLIIQGFWAQRPYYIRLLGCFEPEGNTFPVYPFSVYFRMVVAPDLQQARQGYSQRPNSRQEVDELSALCQEIQASCCLQLLSQGAQYLLINENALNDIEPPDTI